MTNDVSVAVGDAMRLLRRGLSLGVVLAVVFGLATYLWSQRQDPVYEAQATVLVSSQTADFRSFGVSPFVAPAIDVSAYEVASRSDAVAQAALAALGEEGASLPAFRALYRVSSRDDGTSALLTVTGRAPSPERAAAVANAVANALVAWDVERATRSVQQVVQALEQQIAALTEQVRALQALGDPARQSEVDGLISLRAQQQQSLAVARAMGASAIGRLEVIQHAVADATPVAPRPFVNALLAALAGLVVAYGVVIMRSILNTRLGDVAEVEAVSGVPILAEFQRLAKPTRRLPREAASYLRTGVLFATADASPRVILVTSGRSGEGKSAVALNLAESFARNDYRTLLVDADLRQPVLFQEYGLRRGQASELLDFLRDPDGPHMVARVPLGGRQRLDIVPSFQVSTQAAEILGRGFSACVNRWGHDYDVIVVDSPPVLAVADALTIAPSCTGAVLAVSMRKADRRPLRATLDLLERMGVRLLGIAATMVDEPRLRSVGGYGYGYGAPQPTEQAAPPRPEAKVSVRSTSNTRRG
jgi:capsular exopolysaccharide synthesis family protein